LVIILGGVYVVEPYIELDDVSFAYERCAPVIQALSLKLYKEQFTAITGPNGSGKTTLGKVMTGILRPQKGRVIICGKDSADMKLGEIGRRIGYLFQNPALQIFAPTVREEISFALELKGYSKEEIDSEISRSLKNFDLVHRSDAFPFKLSRGEKQRLAIAAMLVNKPDFLILDEPTTGLDMERRRVLSDILLGLKKKGIGMAVISHDRAFVACLADRTIRMYGGEIVEDRT
jgi:energy-coupling factor transport system ATP-binding protein